MRELASASLKTAQVQPYVYHGIERLSRVERRSVRNNLSKILRAPAADVGDTAVMQLGPGRPESSPARSTRPARQSPWPAAGVASSA